MVNQSRILLEYSNSVRTLRKQCIDAGMNEEEFQKLYQESLKSLEKSQEIKINSHRFKTKCKLFVGIVIIALIMLLCGYWCKSVYGSFMCNLQDYIYPGLRFLRRISIPFISLFPSLTEYYHETCLIQNPFFMVVDMDCWPCSSITSIGEVHDPKPLSLKQQHSAPFIYETEQEVITLDKLKDFYTRNKEFIDNEYPKVQKNNKYFDTINHIFSSSYVDQDDNLYIWKMNTMNMARLFRQIIQRPTVVPKFGQSTERFIIIDSSQDAFKVPDTECSYSFLLFLSGSRTIDLVPAEECKYQCKTLKVELKESYLLWYNWWYWRPVVQPSNGNNTLIAHLGSYC